MYTSLQVLGNLGAADVDSRLEEQLIDGILFAFQEQTTEVCVCVVLCTCIEYSLFSTGCDHVEWIWCSGQRSRDEGKALSPSDLWNYSLEVKQQGC